MYCHCAEYGIKYSDVDFQDNLKLSSLMAFMLESACYSANELGFGYDVLQPKGIGFVLVNWHIELYKNIKLADKLTVHTWPIKPKKSIVFRDFELFVGGEKVGVATSRWCLVDLEKFNVLPTSIALDLPIDYNEKRAVEVTNWKIPAVVSDVSVYEKTVAYSDYDHYNHANNTKYGDFLMDAFSVDEMKGKRIASARVTYIKQTKCGEKLSFYKQPCEDGGYIVEGRVGDELHVQMHVVLNEI